MFHPKDYNANHLDRQLKRKLQSKSRPGSKRSVTSKRRRSSTPSSKNKSRKIKHPRGFTANKNAEQRAKQRAKQRATQRTNLIKNNRISINEWEWSSNMNYFETLPYGIRLYKRNNDSRLDISNFLDKHKGSKYDPFLSKIQDYFLKGFFNPTTTQKYCDFVQSEILFRGNSLLYLLYLEIYPYLVPQYEPEDNSMEIQDEDEPEDDSTGMEVEEPEDRSMEEGGSFLRNHDILNSKHLRRFSGESSNSYARHFVMPSLRNRPNNVVVSPNTHQRQITGGRQNLDKLTKNEPDCKILLIYAAKLLSELHHDVKGQGKTLKTLDDIVKIYKTNIGKIESGPTCGDGSENETAFFNNLMSGHGEWHFFKCTLDYLIDKGLFDELTIIKYRSVVDSNRQKDYFLLDIDGKEAIPLFDSDVFDIRYPDNSTCDSALSKLIRDPPSGLDWKPKLIVQNAPSLTDPATIGFIDVAKFYPAVVPEDTSLNLFNFQKCQDLNNYFDPFNKIIVGIMCEGINTFFSLFGGKYENNFDAWNGTPTPPSSLDRDSYTTLYNAAPIKFIIMGPDKTPQIIPTQPYFEYLQRANTTPGPEAARFYYSGIIIKSTTGDDYELRVGDTTIKNITELVNSDYVNNWSATPSPSSTSMPKEQSWFRLCSLANYIKTTIPNNRFTGNTDVTVLKFLIVCLKALGDWFQVFYVSSIHYRCLLESEDDFARQFKGLVKYLSSSDKNTIADMMIHSISTNSEQSLRFLGNGFSVKPSENLYKRFPAFFDNPAIPPSYGEDFGVSIAQTSNEDQMPPKGKDNDENEEVEDSAGVGSLKGIFLNFKKEEEDLKGKVQKLLQELTNDYNKLTDTNKSLFQSIVREQNNIFNETDNNILLLLFSQITTPIPFDGYQPPSNASQVVTALTDDKLKIIKTCLTKIPLIFQVSTTNISTIETELKLAIDLQEAQMKAIGKIVESKYGPTRDEIAKLQSMFKNPVINDLQTKITNKITKLLGPSNILKTNVKNFSEKIQNAVNDSRTKLSSFFGKIKSNAAKVQQGRSSGRSKIYGTNELIEEFDPVYNPLRSSSGGRRRARRTMKRQHARTMKNRVGKQ